MFCALAFFLQFLAAWALSGQIEAKAGLVRREGADREEKHQALTLTPFGGVEEDELAENQGELKTYPHALGYHPPEEVCNDDFLLGENNSNRCLNETYHRKIIDENMCLNAAELNGRMVEHAQFIISTDYKHMHPKGCFEWRCYQTNGENRNPDNTSLCYYYNKMEDDDGEPEDPHGPPVCYRAEYLNGTVGTNGNCDPGFENVMDEEACKFAADCLGYAKEPEFRVGEWNWTKHDEYPKGCFIRADTGAFQFNNISSLLTRADKEPRHPEHGGGIPVCNVSRRVHLDIYTTSDEARANNWKITSTQNTGR